MSDPIANPRVVMIRARLDDFPLVRPPTGFTLRGYEPGDEAHWLRIHRAADRFSVITPTLFREQFGEDCALLAQRQWYALSPEGEVVGTGTAWFNDRFEGGRWGRVHWLAVLPGFQGRGLGRALLSAVGQRLRELGHTRAYLTTGAARLPAIALYLSFGFEPLVRSQDDARLWRDIRARLAR